MSGRTSPACIRVLHNHVVATPSASFGAAVYAREAEVLAAVSYHLTNAETVRRTPQRLGCGKDLVGSETYREWWSTESVVAAR